MTDSIINNDITEWNDKAGKAENPEYAAAIKKQYEDIIRTKRKILYP